jgi:hypothetical protein
MTATKQQERASRREIYLFNTIKERVKTANKTYFMPK